MKPRHLEEIYFYTPESHWEGTVRISKMVYYAKRVTYAEVSGDTKFKGGVDFFKHWGVFSRNEDGNWHLTGRNDTANIERMQRDDCDRRWYRSWDEAHRVLIERLIKNVDHHQSEHDKYVRLLAKARELKEPEHKAKRRRKR